MVKHKDDEDEDDILENDIDESDEDADEDESDGKSSKKKEEDTEIEILIEEDEKKDDRVAVQGRKTTKEESTEEKRERRRRERKLKNSRNYANARELENLRQVVAKLAKENEEIKGMAGEFGKREAIRDEQQINDAINSQKGLYTNAERQFTKAIAEGDGPAAAEAQRIMGDAQNKYNQLNNLKSTHDSNRRAAETQKKEPVQQKDTRLQQVYISRFLAKNDWFDPAGSDDDSKLAKKIDNEVASEGFDPNTKEYWDEVEDRLRDEIPHVFRDEGVRRTIQAKPRPRQTNGSIGADSGSSNSRPNSIKIPERVVKMAKDAGQWDDPKMRQLFVKNWKEQNRTEN